MLATRAKGLVRFDLGIHSAGDSLWNAELARPDRQDSDQNDPIGLPDARFKKHLIDLPPCPRLRPPANPFKLKPSRCADRTQEYPSP